MLSEPLRYELYGLRHGNPYRIEPLDPLARAGDRSLLVDIDGFVSTDALRTYLRRTVEAGESAFVVVSGRDYTGRTTIANHVLDVYRQVSELDDRLLVSRIKVGHNRDFEWVKEAMVELQNEIEEADLTLSPALTESLNTIEGIDEGVYQSRYRGLARRLHGELAGQARGRCSFGVVFEGLRQTSLVDAMRKVFKSSRSIAVFTHGDYKHANTPSYEELSRLDVHLIKLEPLKGEQVRCLAEERWRAASALPSPFPPDSLETAWPAPTPIKSVVKTLSLLLDIRLGSAADHGPWPDNTELEIPHRFMFFMIRMLNELGAS